MVSKSFYYFRFNEMLCDSRPFLTDNCDSFNFFIELYVIELMSVLKPTNYFKCFKKSTFNHHQAIITFTKIISFYGSSHVRMCDFFFFS